MQRISLKSADGTLTVDIYNNGEKSATASEYVFIKAAQPTKILP